MQIFNGHAKVISLMQGPEIVLGTDSCLSGFASVWDSQWLVGPWAPEKARLDVVVPSHHLPTSPDENQGCSDINVLELWPVLLAIHEWGYLWKDRKVTLWIDNTQVMQMVLTGRSRSVKCMGWLRDLFWVCAFYNIHL